MSSVKLEKNFFFFFLLNGTLRHVIAVRVADLPAVPCGIAHAGTWECVVLHPRSSPGLSEELRGKKRIEAARWMEKSARYMWCRN